LSVFTNSYGKNMDSRRSRTGWTLLLCLTIGCSATRRSPAVLPAPSAPPINPSSVSSWSFIYAPGVRRYQISRSAAIDGQTDSGSNREISTNTTRELITLAPAGDSAIGFTAVVDAFASTTQGLIGPVQATQLPVQVSGIFAESGLTITTDAGNGRCNPVGSAILSDLHNLLTRFPVLLSRGLAWRDSVNTAGCQAGIPTTSSTTRSYVVSGESVHEGQPVLVVQRVDTIRAQGEGAQGQHSVKLSASGTGSAIYFLDTRDGRLVRLTTGQEMTLTVSTSGKAHQFRQSSRQEFRLAP
jgi:hypothetical protein